MKVHRGTGFWTHQGLWCCSDSSLPRLCQYFYVRHHNKPAQYTHKYASPTCALWALRKCPVSSVWHMYILAINNVGTRIFTTDDISPVTIQSQQQWTWPCSLVCMYKSMYACIITESCLPMPGWPGRPRRQNNRGIKHCMYHPVHKSYNKGTCMCILYKTFRTWGTRYVTVDSHLVISLDIN